MRDPLGYLQSMQAQYGDVVMLKKGDLYIVAAPDGVQRILQDNHPNYEKGPRYRRAMRTLLGNGLLLSEGSTWMRQRRVAQSALLKKNHPFFEEVIRTRLDEAREEWTAAARDGRTLDLEEEMVRITVAIIFRLLFSEALGSHEQELVGAMLACQREVNLVRVFSPIRVPDWIPTPSNRRLQRGRAVLDRFLYETIQARRRSAVAARDLLGLYLEAKFEDTGEPLDDLAVRDEMMTLLMAGHETTAISLTWLVYLLTNHADVRGRLLGELDNVVGSRPVALADFERLPFLDRTVREGLRLYPSVWGFMRVALHDDTICGYRIPAGSGVLISPYLTQRLPGIWDDPGRFDPDRFLPGRSEGQHRFAWFPFSSGPRVCPGTGLAFLEAAFILTALIQEFSVELLAGPEIVPSPRISLKPSRPVLIRLKPRFDG